MLHERSKTSSLEKLASQLKENTPSKWLLDRAIYSIYVRLEISEDEMVPLKLLFEISSAWRDVKFPRQGGRYPEKLLSLRSKTCRFLSLHKTSACTSVFVIHIFS